MHRHRIIQGVFLAITTGYLLFGGLNQATSDPQKPQAWQIAHSFVKRLDSATIGTEPIDPKNPPALAIWLLTSGSGQLDVHADYINLTSANVTLHGRRIKDPASDARRFYPYARLEVSDGTEGGWRVIGRSPDAGQGVETAVVIVPVKIGIANSKSKRNETCVIDMNSFRPFVGKLRYGRVVLENDGGTSQVITLTDLLPPE